jgi:hypothetical protein
MQGDGNFVVYDCNRAQWWSGTSGNGVYLIVQSDGRVGIYAANGTLLWMAY